jgi:putative ABC transport system permease protein
VPAAGCRRSSPAGRCAVVSRCGDCGALRRPSDQHGLIGLLTALVAAGLGTLAAYGLVTGPMHSNWVFLPAPLLATVGLAVIVTLVLGFAGTWRALGAKPAHYLRNE